MHVSTSHACVCCVQAEDAKKAAEEAAAKALADAVAAALASSDPVERLRAMLAADKDAPTIVKELKGMTVEGGVAGGARAGRMGGAVRPNSGRRGGGEAGLDLALVWAPAR